MSDGIRKVSLEVPRKEWLSYVCAGLGINEKDVTFIYVKNFLGNSELTIEYEEKVQIK